MSPVFYLGTHMPSWLADPGVDFELFISYNRLFRRRTLPVSTHPWALDSMGFTMLKDFGRWTFSAAEYVRNVRRFRDEIGKMEWAAPMDRMCEDAVIRGGWYGRPGRRSYFVGTKLTVPVHQERTVWNYMDLMWLDATLPVIPVLQGYTIAEYLRCRDRYEKAGIDLLNASHLYPQRPDWWRVGLGSVCRRQDTGEIAAIAAEFADTGLALHGFGVKALGLSKYAHDLRSCDSSAWSDRGRHVRGCSPGHKTEANCLAFARGYRTRALNRIPSFYCPRLTSPVFAEPPRRADLAGTGLQVPA
jgi:hypothetical protein